MKRTTVLDLCCVLFSNLTKSVPTSVALLQPIWSLRGSLLLLFCFFLLCNAQYCYVNTLDLGVSSSSHFWPPSFVLVFSWNGEFEAEYECAFKGCMRLSDSHLLLSLKSLRCREASWLLDASRKTIFERCFLHPPLTRRQAHSSLSITRANQTFIYKECVFSGLDPKQCCSRVLERLM